MNEHVHAPAPDLAQEEEQGMDYNPLEYSEGVDEEDWEDDDRLILPDPLAQAEEPKRNRVSVYSPQYAGSVENALTELVKANAGRRRILLSIVGWARDGIVADELSERIAEVQADNLSVYEPVSYCRMLERAGALEFVDVAAGVPGTQTAYGTVAGDESPATLDELDGLTFMGIDDEVKPIWRATEEGLAAAEGLTRGDEWREKVLGEDAMYAEVYLAVMQLIHEGGKTKSQVCDVAEAFEVTHEPRKWGAYFIDVLEATDAIQWKGQLWVLTGLGESLLDELAEYCAQAA